MGLRVPASLPRFTTSPEWIGLTTGKVMLNGLELSELPESAVA